MVRLIDEEQAHRDHVKSLQKAFGVPSNPVSQDDFLVRQYEIRQASDYFPRGGFVGLGRKEGSGEKTSV